MGYLRKMSSNILPSELMDLLRERPEWIYLILTVGGLGAFLEALTLANLLFLGFAVLGQEPHGMIGSLIGERVLGVYTQQTLLIGLGSSFIVLVIMRLMLLMWFRYLSYRWSSRVGGVIHKKIMSHIISAPMEIFDERQLGDLLHGLMYGPAGAISATDSFTSLISSVFVIGTMAIMLALISPWVLLLAGVFAVLWFSQVVPRLHNVMRRYQQQKYDLESEGMKIATDTINGIREIRALAGEARRVGEFSQMVDSWEQARGRIVMLGAASSPALQGLLQIGFAAAVIIAAIRLSPESLITQLPVLATFAYGLFRVCPVVSQASTAWIGLGIALPGMQDALELAGLPEDPLAGGTQQVVNPIEMIRFEHLSFSYASREPAIVDADFCMYPGKVTAIVGASGAGKSTLIDLMLKFRSPTQGVMWLGKQNLSDVIRGSWLDRVGVVRQDVFLFAGSIRENLVEFKSDASEEEFRSACGKAGALEFIDALPLGLDTRLGERGVTLSGGQRQRIAIARALLRNPDVLILDEAMSALDGETEAQILKSLLDDSGTRIIVLISHRLATVRNADHIIVLDQGRVVEQGAHDELLEKHGRFWGLFSTQVGLQSVAFTDSTHT